MKLSEQSDLVKDSWFLVKYLCCFPNLVSIEEIARAKKFWIFIIQRAYFEVDISLLKNGKTLQDLNLRRLDPFLEQNLLRLGGRIYWSLLDHDQKHPWIFNFLNY